MSEAAPRGKPRLLVRIAAVVAVIAISSFVALLIAEGAVRLAAPQQLIQMRPDLWQPVDTLGYVRRSNVTVGINTGEREVSVFTDAEGFRVGREGRKNAQKQVLLIGDSFVEALQVDHEQTMAYLLEKMLQGKPEQSVAVRNAGVSGWNPNHYLLRTRQLLNRERFAVVIVAVFVGNDAVRMRFDRVPPREAVPRHELRFPRKASWSELVDAVLAPLNDGLEVRSHLYILAKNQLSTVRMRLGLTADYMPSEYLRSEATSPRWRNVGEILRDLDRTAAAKGTPALFVLIPERFQVYRDEFERHLKGFGIDSSTVDVDQPSRLLSEQLRAQKLRVLDALPALRAAAAKSDERLYGRVDQHLSPAGHQVLATAMFPEVQSLLRK